MAGACMVNVNGCDASGATPLLAVIVRGKLPAAEAVPAKVAVPSPLSVNVTPAGSVPVSEMAATGAAVETMVKLPAAFTMKVVPLALVIVGAAVPTRLPAVKLR